MTTTQQATDNPTCPECPKTCESMDRLVDHLTDDHDAFTRATQHGSNNADVLDDVQLHISLTAVPDN